jgi:hypothetical protein
MSTLVEHWLQLTGPVHPQDAEIFRANPHSFNLDFPPPVFLGDVINARVILLNLNGGYDPAVTPTEFPDEEARQRHLDAIHNPRPMNPAQVAPYYSNRNYAQFIRSGAMALVNAVPYRSRKFSDEPENKKLVEHLPSTHVHRTWLREELLPSARRGTRLVIAHRTSLWGLHRKSDEQAGLIFSKCPASPNLSRAGLAAIKEFLECA